MTADPTTISTWRECMDKAEHLSNPDEREAWASAATALAYAISSDPEFLTRLAGAVFAD